MSNFSYKGTVELEYFFDNWANYSDYDSFNEKENSKIDIPHTPLQTVGFFFRHLLNPFSETMDLFKKLIPMFESFAHTVEKLENLRKEGKCVLIVNDRDLKKDHPGFSGTVKIIVNIDIMSKRPEDLLSCKKRLEHIKDEKLHKKINQCFNDIVVSLLPVEQFAKKYETVLENLNSGTLKELSSEFVNDLIFLFKSYLDDLIPFLELSKKLKEKEKSELQTFDNELGGHVNINMKINATSTNKRGFF